MLNAKHKIKAVILLSGGLDSTTTLAIAKSKKFECYSLSFDYGQKQESELQSAKNIAKIFITSEHRVVKISLSGISKSALTNDNIDVPKFSQSNKIPITYVPARNTIFLSYALAWSEVLNCQHIFIGVNELDYSGYPDCRKSYIKAFEIMANLATKQGIEGQKLTIHTPLIHLNKAQIIKKGLSLGIDYTLTTTCYQADKNGKACGICDACEYRKLGFKEAKVPDQTRYQT
ncbi:7-cyano-7-deazaguanine synthase QueC [Candidatus Vesicomyidisocius calyptogenae]|uniref:7-cyano-7-deazaguanine synthase n=1 Tax=Vesicomyosocius okutanii subsp. Calyptogena okutanii (strain HA) TaxID=412965 RepID=QUEC_VESOH|nr:7-cyano-7-deazaguanine synthase QueC [Candidatus Vesicomyosocius okutanii]A5CWP9.1 RecName: Full=7-cyano-7-deazaguanine synthase; AltName: Full=7-cyano-7-carbaguanine synthase; AltName: Full=PreQ(0) synthase; AltName: Full=Queuosine biosynthesis protein QueC [Candidatus Vesicomyosocius okutanii]BAF61638.1 trans-regulatory protein ExsB [Candidatus Vesicomyosocius okutanii]